jgi:hypothetical protein
MQIKGIRRWIKQCKERAKWKRISEKSKTHSEFSEQNFSRFADGQFL